METHTFLAEKIKPKQLIPIISFVVLPFILNVLSYISTIVLIQFLLLSILCIIIILVWHFNTKITISNQYIMYRSIFKRYKINWTEIKETGTFTAVGLTIITKNQTENKSFFSTLYIYVSCSENEALEMVKKNSKTFIRFNYNEKANDLIKFYSKSNFNFNFN